MKNTRRAGINFKRNQEKEREIVAGWYCTEDGKNFSCSWLDEDDFRTNVMNMKQ